MTLPQINVPRYNFTIPSTGRAIRYRPFLVKEQKVLLMALEGKDEKEITQAVKDIIRNCVVEHDVDVEEFTTFDLEMFFLHLRAKSMGETIEATFRCQRQIPDGPETDKTHMCNGMMEISYNVMETKIDLPPKEIKNIKITDTIGIMMKYPSLKMMGNKPVGLDRDMPKEIQLIYEMIMNCVDFIYDGNTIFTRNTISDEELSDFIDKLTQDQFAKIEKFFESVPVVKKEIERECPQCKHKHVIVLEGLQSFFG